MSNDIKQAIDFYDGAKEVTFYDDFDSLKEVFGSDYKKIKKKYVPKGCTEAIFTIRINQLMRFFNLNYGDFDELVNEDVFDYLELKEDDPFIEQCKGKDISLKWKPVSDDDNDVFYLLIDPSKTSLCILDYLIKNDETIWFAFDDKDNVRYVVILWKNESFGK